MQLLAPAQEQGYDPYTTHNEQPLITQIMASVMRFKWLILSIVAASLIAGGILTLLTTPQFTATTRLEISREQANVTNVKGLERADPVRDQEFYETQYALLRSRTLAERVAKELDLKNNSTFMEMMGGTFGDTAIGANLTQADIKLKDRAIVNYLSENVVVTPVRGSSLVDIAFSSPNSSLSALITNAWAKQFMQSNQDRRFASTSDARVFLEGRLADLREKLEKSEADLVNYANANNIVALEQKESLDGKTATSRTLAQTNLEAANAELARATAARIEAESAARYAHRSPGVRTPNSALVGLRQKRAEVAAEYAAIMARFEPGYPPAQALASELAALDRSIAAEESNLRANENSVLSANAADVDASVNGAYRQAVSRENDLKRQVAQLEAGFTTERQATIQYNIYQREVDTNRELYNGLLQRYKEIGVAGVGTNNVAVVDPAEVPRKPSSPILLVNLAVAAVAGLGLAGLAVFILMQIDQTVKTAEDVKRELGMAMIGVVPSVERSTLIKNLEDPKSEISEAYLSINTALSFLTNRGIPKTMMMTSSRASEGKSASAHALSLILARRGLKVALIDADMRSPSVSEQWEMANDAGLSNALSGQDDWRNLMKATQMETLDLMLTGPEPPNAAELLAGPRLAQLIAQMSTVYDHIIIDSPPVLGLADAPLISTVVDGVLYAVEANGVKTNGIRSCLERLKMVKANIYGVILTKVDMTNGSGYGYGYGYGYGKGSTGFNYGKND
jgi:polysaccharide biosynthesis transport protein